MEQFISIIFKAEEETTAMIVAMLMAGGFEGVEETDDQTVISISESAYDDAAVHAVFKQFGVEYSRRTIPQQNWNAQWESSFEPVKVGQFAAIRAAFHGPVPDVAHEIVITPKMSFGTGHHATTFLMIQEMSTIDFAGKTVTDFGTGTGVLAILAEKLGASKVLAIDNDDWSINNARENIETNSCKRIQLEKAEVMLPNKVDIILANINLNVIVANLINLK
ncbi:MAG: 50S ribosomal protein L11 methyltransferase, partial [Chitinophagaceae bacterium]